MVTSKYDQTIKLIARNNSLYELPKSHLDYEVLDELMEEGMIKKVGKDRYCLTGYGEIIEVMGYHSHKHTNGNKNLSWIYNRKRKFGFYVVIILLAIIGLIFYLL